MQLAADGLGSLFLGNLESGFDCEPSSLSSISTAMGVPLAFPVGYKKATYQKMERNLAGMAMFMSWHARIDGLAVFQQ